VLLAGDVSGIQDYIFAISTTGAGGVAKRLRARSFFVQMLSDVAGLRLLREFDLPLANLLMASGGNFYALLPNLPDTQGKSDMLQSEFNGWLLDKFHGALTISLAWTPVGDGEFADGHFGKVNERLHESLREKKKQRLADQLQNGTGWQEQKHFVREADYQGMQICKSCYRLPGTATSDDGDDICNQCERQLRLGRKLTTSEYLSFYQPETSGGEFECLGWRFSLSDKPPRPEERPHLVVRLNDPDLKQARRLPATFRYLANHIRHEPDGTPWTFEDIAADAGRKLDPDKPSTRLLGVLKADVDYLGQVFQEGLRRDEPEKGFDSIARIATLSRQLDWFFSGWLEWLLTNDARFQSCYTVYSGGDDLLIVGPRAKSLELARKINDEFARYTGDSRITISAGIAVVKPRLPLAHTVKQADKALEKAKDAGRNRLSALGEVSEWSKLDNLDRIYKLLADSDAPSALLYQLLRFARMWREFADPQRRDPRGLMLVPMLAETLARNVDRNKQPKLHEWGCQLLAFPFQNQKAQADLDQLALTVQWFILGRREK
jgi:CRISPR-associated protein Csm1